MKIKLIAITAMALQLGACSTIVNGTNQEVAFSTGQVEGADCTLTGGSDNALNQTFTTPTELKLPRSKKALNISCSKAGYDTVEKQVTGKIEGSTGGNIIAGGGIGVGIDALTGAIYKYPDAIDLPMVAVGTAVSPTVIAE